MKKVIRLTESDIRRMVMEAMNELDWKTYMNAAKKAHNIGLQSVSGKPKDGPYDLKKFNDYINKEYKFQDAANKAFNRDFGVDDGRYYMQLEEPKVPNSIYDRPLHVYDRRDQCPIGDTPLDLHYAFDRGRVANKDIVDAYDTARQEYDDYEDGNYEYQKGKGWVNKNDELEEAVFRAIHKYLK